MGEQEVTNIRIEKAAQYLYQAVIPVVLNNHVEFIE